MQTRLSEDWLQRADGREADAILRKCVHCGFCLATCPTYQLLHDELDSPRGRIYLIKQVLEGETPSVRTQLHLDRCLTCRACETTCPSGVQYGRLLDIGRAAVEQRVARPTLQELQRRWLRQLLLSRTLFGALLALGRAVRPLLPTALARRIPQRRAAPAWPAARHARRVLALDACVQPSLAPSIDAAAARVLDRVGISLVKVDAAGCCGALSQHLGAPAQALDHARRNIDAWWPHIEAGAEAIVMTASGCGAHVAGYGHLLRDDPDYAAKARRVSEMTRDIAQVLAPEMARLLPQLAPIAATRLAFHAPCTLQHGLKQPNLVEPLLSAAGYTLTMVPDAHLCCGSAGTYSILQPQLSQQLQQRKTAALLSGEPVVIASANIGCLLQLQSATALPVRHWIELLAERV